MRMQVRAPGCGWRPDSSEAEGARVALVGESTWGRGLLLHEDVLV
jgi:hypothetical protein